MKLHIGLDSLDYGLWGCTTYYVFQILREFYRSRLSSRVKLADYPLLTRLNPAIPLKTRGNGSVSIHFKGYEEDLWEIVDIVKQVIESGDTSLNTVRGGVIAVFNDLDKGRAVEIYHRGLSDYLSIDQVERYLRNANHVYILKGRGIIGSLVSIAHHFIPGDCTYELIGYSMDDRFSIDRDRVEAMDRSTKPYTFNNIDPETGKILITPRIGKPTVLGIRGEVPHILIRSLNILNPKGLDGYIVFRSNQATDQHMFPWISICRAKIYRTGVFIGRVSSEPKILRGGDVIVEISNGSGCSVSAAFYREMGVGNAIARKLSIGDTIMVGGSVKPWIVDGSVKPVINVEHFKILAIEDLYIYRSPRCPVCGKRMTSLGSGKGFRCRRCGYRDYKAVKVREHLAREIPIGVLFKPPPRYLKHLTKPIERFGFEKVCFSREIDSSRYLDLAKF